MWAGREGMIFDAHGCLSGSLFQSLLYIAPKASMVGGATMAGGREGIILKNDGAMDVFNVGRCLVLLMYLAQKDLPWRAGREGIILVQPWMSYCTKWMGCICVLYIVTEPYIWSNISSIKHLSFPAQAYLVHNTNVMKQYLSKSKAEAVILLL